MKRYLLIESESAFEAAGAPQVFALACELKRQGDAVEILLVQNGVMPARAGAKADGLGAALQAGIPVMADEFSMKERALPAEALARGVRPAPISTVVSRMASGWNVIWH
ncbi:MAG: sulfur reduction protein DsrE [Micropepsaceae bacterium]